MKSSDPWLVTSEEEGTRDQGVGTEDHTKQRRENQSRRSHFYVLALACGSLPARYALYATRRNLYRSVKIADAYVTALEVADSR